MYVSCMGRGRTEKKEVNQGSFWIPFAGITGEMKFDGDWEDMLWPCLKRLSHA